MIDQLEPNSAIYNLCAALHLDGALDPAALERSLATVVQRHEALRTAFIVVNGTPRQVIVSDRSFALAVVDASSRSSSSSPSSSPSSEREAEALALAEQEGRRPFDLASGRLLRATLFRFAAREHLLLLTMHHIVSDGGSIQVIWRELEALYSAFERGLPSPLPELPIQVADHAVWQRAWLSGEALTPHLAYWKEQLRGAPPALDLPTDRPRPPTQSYRGARHSFLVPEDVSTALRTLCRRQGLTLFMTLLAAFQVLLHRHSGQDDIVVGTAISGRTRVELEGLIGFLVNTLVLRVRFDGAPTFLELCAQVREVTLSAYAHQDVPFEKLAEELSPVRDLGRSPLFQAMLILQNEADEAPRFGEVAATPVEVETATSKFDLTLYVKPGPRGLVGTLEYATDLFDASTIQRMAAHFGAILGAVARDPAVKVGAIALLDEAERSRILHAWNDTATPLPEGVGLHDLFEAQVDRTPHAVALIEGGERLDYRRLDAWSNAIAHRLRALDLGQDKLVGVSVRRSAALVAAMLGILKAGAAYVPLDPGYPRARLAQILEQSGVRVVVSDALGRETLTPGEVEHVPAAEPREGEVTARLDSHASAHALAYVLFTSGSTGTPKGVAIEHRSAVALVAWARRIFSPDELACVLFSTSIAFDLSVFEVFVPLAAGGRIVVAENALELPTLGAAGEVTLINTVPSAMTELLRAKGLPPSVRTVCLAGEPLTESLASAVYAEPTVERLYNLYGPTEATTYATFHEVRRDGSKPTIGRPIDNSKAYILGPGLEPVPIGVLGEIYLGGQGIARGYLHQPELTRERFTPSPFVPGERLYRTGDLGRFRANGEMEYQGRTDHQVKIRGYRIELGEVESVLQKMPAVREAVVVVREDAPGDRRLVAYVVLEGDTSSVSALREHLGARLPAYLVPSAFVVLQALPLTSNGKLDRNALPAPERLPPREIHGAPRT
ncbi:MAG: amino acid adenylation domain-containing protein, partial [Minicystis sp.]